MPSVDQYRAGLSPESLRMIDMLRGIVMDSHANLTEHIKWNGPTFALDGEDRITLGLDRKGGARVVLHRGATVRDTDDFRFEDSSGLATWPASNRGVVIFTDPDMIEAKQEELKELCRRWIDT